MAHTDDSTVQILVVENDPSLLEVVCEILEDAGYGVMAATGVQAGLDALGRSRPDVVVTDYAMPDGTARDIIAGASGLPAPPPVIVMSGSVSTDVVPALLSAGATEVLAKPFSLRNLLGVVGAAAERRSAGHPGGRSSDSTSPSFVMSDPVA